MITVYVKTYSTDRTYTVKINKYESILSLKERLRELDNIDFDAFFLLHGGRALDDIRSLAAYGIDHGSTIQMEPKLNGGNIFSIEILLAVVLMIGFGIFFLLMSTGALPVIANVFYYLIKYALDSIIGIFTSVWNFIKQEEAGMETVTGQLGGQQRSGKFNMEAAKTKYKKLYQNKMEQEGAAKASNYNFLSWIYDTFLFILKNGITMIFIYTFAAILTFPILFYKTSDQCKSLNLASYVGILTAMWYFLFYGLYFNTIDGLINTYLFASSILPNFLKFIPDFLASTVKDSWDESKFAGWYAIPFVGEALMVYHETIQSTIMYLKEFLDQESQYGCDDKAKYENLQNLFANIIYKNKKNGAHVEHIDNVQVGDSYITSMLREFIKMFKLNATMELLNINLNEGKEYEAEFSTQPFFKKFLSGDYWNWQVSGILMSVFCLLLKFATMINNFINAMNGPLGLANMIKSGNISGILTFIAFICIVAYTVIFKA